MPGKLRVWWIPQVPMKQYQVEVPDIDTAIIVLKVLAEYDAFQFENNIKPDYCNTGGLQEFNEEAQEWWDWEDEDGDNIDEFARKREEKANEPRLQN